MMGNYERIYQGTSYRFIKGETDYKGPLLLSLQFFLGPQRMTGFRPK
jgi:hypothetical protein